METIIETFTRLAGNEFLNPGWMEEFFVDIVRKKQYVVTVDDDCDISSFICCWQFGNKRWGFIRKIRSIDKCPKQMGKGKHLYIPLFWIREDRRGEITIKKFLTILKREYPDATTLSWHNETGQFITYKLIRRQDNVNIQEEKSTVNTECGK